MKITYDQVYEKHPQFEDHGRPGGPDENEPE